MITTVRTAVRTARPYTTRSPDGCSERYCRVHGAESLQHDGKMPLRAQVAVASEYAHLFGRREVSPAWPARRMPSSSPGLPTSWRCLSCMLRTIPTPGPRADLASRRLQSLTVSLPKTQAVFMSGSNSRDDNSMHKKIQSHAVVSSALPVGTRRGIPGSRSRARKLPSRRQGRAQRKIRTCSVVRHLADIERVLLPRTWLVRPQCACYVVALLTTL